MWALVRACYARGRDWAAPRGAVRCDIAARVRGSRAAAAATVCGHDQWRTLRHLGPRPDPDSRRRDRLLVLLDVNKNQFARVNYGSGRDVSDESVADAGEPLHVSWHTDSFIEVPARAPL